MTDALTDANGNKYSNSDPDGSQFLTGLLMFRENIIQQIKVHQKGEKNNNHFSNSMKDIMTSETDQSRILPPSHLAHSKVGIAKV